MSGQTVLIAASVVLSYLVGAIPFGYIIAKVKGVDIREVGSGNIGATNVGRALGRRWGLVVFLLDALKGGGVVLLARLVVSPYIGVSGYFLGSLCGGASVLGHIFPVYLRMRGGKGVATGAGATAALLPLPLLVAATVWGLILLFSRIVSVASISSSIAFLSAHFLLGPKPSFSKQVLPVTIYAFLLTTLVLIRHRANIKRLIEGKEPRIGRKTTADDASC